MSVGLRGDERKAAPMKVALLVFLIGSLLAAVRLTRASADLPAPTLLP